MLGLINRKSTINKTTLVTVGDGNKKKLIKKKKKHF